VCDIALRNDTGEIGKGFIHVHHKRPLAALGKRYRLNAVKDLVPVCPNCHAMLQQARATLRCRAVARDPAIRLTHAESARRHERVGASGDLRAVATEITEQVRLLDGLVRYRFGDDAELMTAWASARNVAGPFRSKAEPGAKTPAIVKPAA